MIKERKKRLIYCGNYRVNLKGNGVKIHRRCVSRALLWNVQFIWLNVAAKRVMRARINFTLAISTRAIPPFHIHAGIRISVPIIVNFYDSQLIMLKLLYVSRQCALLHKDHFYKLAVFRKVCGRRVCVYVCARIHCMHHNLLGNGQLSCGFGGSEGLLRIFPKCEHVQEQM